MEPLLVKDVFLLYFLRGDSDLRQYKEKSLRGFSPLFVHQLFSNEVLYGYKDLEVHVVYHIYSPLVLLQVRYSLKDSSAIGFVDVESLLYEHLPSSVCTNMEQFERKLTKVSPIERNFSTWHVILPFGDLESDTKVYMQHIANTTAAVEIYNQFKLLLLFYIETASYIDWEDERWDIFVISSFQGGVLGFATAYRFTCLDTTENEWSTRVRIAQFLIFPCFQGKGFGLSLLDAIYSHYIQSGCCFEITVESPCEAFQTMRDVLDTKNCLQLEKRLGYLPSVEQIHKYWKITRKQASRCREIIYYSRLHEEEQKRNFRLQVKKRLSLQFAQQMTNLDSIAARKEYLWQLYKEIEETYRKVWKRVIE